MFFHLTKELSFLNWQAQRHQLGFLFAMLSIVYMVSGCNSTPSKQLYQNSEFGISLEKPSHWSLEFTERNGLIALETETGIWAKESARIEIYGYACEPTPFLPKNPEEELELDVNRIRDLYSLDSVTTIQEPTKTQIRGNEVTTTIISIPTMSLPEDSVRNQVGERDVDIFQIIDISIIRDSKNNSIIVYIYKGTNEQLNADAEDIVNSIELTCLVKP